MSRVGAAGAGPATSWGQPHKQAGWGAGSNRRTLKPMQEKVLLSVCVRAAAQLLETGLLHADPHPGNLIRTPDGRICILDFGLMTEVPPERAQALVEYIAHLSVEDFEAVVMHDLPALGFIPPGVCGTGLPLCPDSDLAYYLPASGLHPAESVESGRDLALHIMITHDLPAMGSTPGCVRGSG